MADVQTTLDFEALRVPLETDDPTAPKGLVRGAVFNQSVAATGAGDNQVVFGSLLVPDVYAFSIQAIHLDLVSASVAWGTVTAALDLEVSSGLNVTLSPFGRPNAVTTLHQVQPRHYTRTAGSQHRTTYDLAHLYRGLCVGSVSLQTRNNRANDPEFFANAYIELVTWTLEQAQAWPASYGAWVRG